MKRVIRLTIIVFLFSVLVFLPSLNALAKDSVIIANTVGEPGNLHPYNTVSWGLFLVSRAAMETLVTVDETGNLVPLLAESWDQSSKEIVFHIRKGVTFHNGDSFTAHDVVFSLKELMLNSTGGIGTFFKSVDAANIVALDDYTVKLPMKKTDATVLPNLNTVFIVPKKAYQEMGDKFQYKPIGTGPFMFGDWQVGDHITFKRYDNYWDGAAKLKTVTYRTIKEASQAIIELQTGGVDVVFNPPGRDVDRVLKGQISGVRAITREIAKLRNNNLNFNWLSKPIRNHKVREAIARTIDREAWTSIISPGNGSPAYSCLPAGVWGYDSSIPARYPYKYDIARAKQLMAEAGYANGFDAVLLTDARPYHQAATQLVQAALKKIGIKVQIKTMDLAQQKQIMVTGKGFDMYMLDNVCTTPDPLNSVWRDSHPRFAKVNSSHYRFYTVKDANGQKYSDLLDEIQITVDTEKRKQLIHDLQQVFIDDIIWLPLNTIQGYVLATEKLSDVQFILGIFVITNKTYFK